MGREAERVSVSPDHFGAIFNVATTRLLRRQRHGQGARVPPEVQRAVMAEQFDAADLLRIARAARGKRLD
jgi:hypothetical protein